MTSPKKVIISGLAGVAVLAMLHLWLNGGLLTLGIGSGANSIDVSGFRVGFLPVTCHLTCPVTDWINQQMMGKGFYQPVRFSGWPELKEAFLAANLQATFMLAPMAMALKQQGVPVKIVYLGHRDGTALVVHKESNIFNFKDLKGKTIAVPNRFSNQRLIIYRGLHDNGMTINDVTLLEMPPPDMPAALYSKSVDAIISGEPFMGQAELDGYGRVLYQARQLWPNFISCVLAVHERIIKEHPEWVQQLVDGIARSGKWLDTDMRHRMEASDAVAQNYYHQDPRLLRFVLSKPPDRVTYTNLALARKDFEVIERFAFEAGILDGSVSFGDYTDTTFSARTYDAQPYSWEVPE